MLIRLREAVKSWVATVFILLLVISFAVWGLADIFVGRTSESLASVGDRHVFPADLDQALDNWVSRQNASGVQTSRSEAAKDGTLLAIASSLIGEALLLGHADKSGISASTQAAANEIEKASVFRDPLKGGFDQISYREYLSQIGQSAEAFEAQLRDSLTYNFLAEAPALGFRNADILTTVWAMYIGEKRKIAFVTITGSDVAASQDPSDSDLQFWMEAHADTYRVPERRALAILEISAADFLDRVSLDEADIEAAYLRRIKEFSDPETRDLTRLSSTERAPLQALVDMINAGTPLDEALETETAKDAIEAKQITLNSDEIGKENTEFKPAFTLEYGQATTPALDPEDETRWLSVAVRDIIPGIAKPLEEVLDDVSDVLRQRKAEEILYEERDRLYDLVGGGASLDEIADQMGGVVRHLAPIDEDGLITANGIAVDALDDYPTALQTAFALSPGQTSDMIDNSDDAVILVAIDEILPAHLPQIDAIRAPLAHAWRNGQQAEAIDDIATNLLSADSFEALQDLAQGFGLSAQRHKDRLNRFGRSKNLEPELIEAIFAAKPKQTVRVTRADGSQIVALVETVISAPVLESNPTVQAGKQIVSSEILRDLRGAFRTEIGSEIKLERNDARINAYIQAQTGEGRP